MHLGVSRVSQGPGGRACDARPRNGGRGAEGSGRAGRTAAPPRGVQGRTASSSDPRIGGKVMRVSDDRSARSAACERLRTLPGVWAPHSLLTIVLVTYYRRSSSVAKTYAEKNKPVRLEERTL